MNSFAVRRTTAHQECAGNSEGLSFSVSPSLSGSGRFSSMT
ncbi:hypothetical protein [Streptomyces sp. NPDC005568]